MASAEWIERHCPGRLDPRSGACSCKARMEAPLPPIPAADPKRAGE